ncbi:MAG TPA: RluA family pseudouridine synthase [Anaerolineales bacterium]|nr:RluA family pseudouridine synthase [Anaerolineales bacterium]
MTEQLHRLQAAAGRGQRLDKFLAAALPQHSRARLQALIKAGRVRINGKPVQKSGHVLLGGESIHLRVPTAEPTDLVPEHIPLDIVFENEEVLIVNKPAGLVVHPAAGHAHGTLVHAALAHAPQIEGVGGELRPGLVHRLDKDTSGLIVLAKNERAQRFLQAQFQSREVRKTYLALVDGHPPTSSGRIEAPIGRDPRERKRMAVVPVTKGRAAVSEYRLIERFPNHALLEVNPLTGRTHQIRVHLAFLGCPVAGYRVYGKRRPSLPFPRHFLHAARLTLRLPGEEDLRTFEAPLPPDLQKALMELRAIGPLRA